MKRLFNILFNSYDGFGIKFQWKQYNKFIDVWFLIPWFRMIYVNHDFTNPFGYKFRYHFLCLLLRKPIVFYYKYKIDKNGCYVYGRNEIGWCVTKRGLVPMIEGGKYIPILGVNP